VSEFTLRRAKFNLSFLMIERGAEPETITLKQLSDRLQTGPSQAERMKLGILRPGAFVGTMRPAHGGASIIFVLRNPDNRGDLSPWLRRDPSIGDRIEQAYYVDRVVYDGQFSESKGKEQYMWDDDRPARQAPAPVIIRR